MFRRKQNVSRGIGREPFVRPSLSFVRLRVLCTDGEERKGRKEKVHDHHERLLREEEMEVVERIQCCADVISSSLKWFGHSSYIDTASNLINSTILFFCSFFFFCSNKC